jgi:hypothetical protein
MAGNLHDHAHHATTQKGYDDSPPRNGVIFFYSVLTVVLLIGVDFLLDSYFAKVMDTEIHDKVLTVGLDEAIETRAQERALLEKSGIDNAIRAISQRGRSASPAIASESGAGKPAVPGWSQLKREEPSAAASAQPTNAANASPQPANPNAQEVKEPGGQGAPKEGKSPVAPGNRAAPTAPAGGAN